MNVDLHHAMRQIIDKSLLDAASAHEQQTLRAHVTTCAPCREYLNTSNRVVAGLAGFSFEVGPELEGKVMASLTLRAQQLELRGEGWPMWRIYLAALMLTIVGSFAVARFSGLAVAAFHLQAAPPASGRARIVDRALFVLLPAVPRFVPVVNGARKGNIQMKIRAFLAIVPKSFKWAALLLAVCSVVAGMTVTVVFGVQHGSISAPDFGGTATSPFGIGLAVAFFGPVWVLCLGYVYADARRRAMPPLLWTLVVAFIPNLLGFLLYFACRRPIAVPCPHCSQPNAPGQRFCSWCGHPAAGPLAIGGLLA